MYKFLKGLVYVLSHILYRVKVIGKENIPSEGAVILSGNHLHAFDSVLLIVNTKRKIHFIAKKELFTHPFMRWIEKPFGLIPINNKETDIVAIKKALKVLKNDEILGIFPEGTRNGMAKNVEIKNGVSFFALKTGVQVVPIGITGNFKLFSKITYNIGEPLDFSEYKNKKFDKEELEKTTNMIMDNIISLTKQ